jgi:DNA topoisomerase-1
VPTVREFWEPFSEQVAKGKENIPKNVEETDIVCPESGDMMLKRLGRNGWFLGCSGYPECKFTMPLPGEEAETIDLPGIGETCPECGQGTLTGKRSRRGPFVGCSRYPDCRYVHRTGTDGQADAPELAGVGEPCPECGQGMLAARRGRFGWFAGCNRYPDCRYIKKREGATRGGSAGRRGARRGSRRRTSPRA